MITPRPVLAVAVAAVLSFVTLLVLEPATDLIPHEQLEFVVGDVAVVIPEGGVTLSEHPVEPANMIVRIAAEADRDLEYRIMDRSGEFDLAHSNNVLEAPVPSSFDLQNSRLVVEFGGDIVVVDFSDGQVTTIKRR